EQLLHLESELLQQDETRDGYYYELTKVYSEMYNLLNLLKRQEHEKYEDRFQDVKYKLVLHYIKYGTYMKMGKQKDASQAKFALRKVLKYDPYNPIAHYRLGFLAYQEGAYSEALLSFQKAIDFSEHYQQ